MGLQKRPLVKEGGPRRQLQTIIFSTIGIVALFVFLSVVSESETFSAKSDHAQVRTQTPASVDSAQIQTPQPKKPVVTESETLSTKSDHAQDRTQTPTSKDSAQVQTPQPIKRDSNEICLSICGKRRQKRAEVFRGDLTDSKALLKLASAEKERLLQKLRKDYGEYFESIFVNSENGKYRPCIGATDEGPSLQRLKRKLMIKILSMQSKIKEQDSYSTGCDCTSETGKALRNNVEEKDDPSLLYEDIDSTAFFEKYVWATGGHSAAAGHGNLFNESYTAYMERDVKDIFGSIGIEFEGRNYAMGGTHSATDVSMCWKEIFGQDVDFFSWDYGMTDGNDVSKLFHFSYRGGISESRPAAMLVHYGGRAGKNRLGAYAALEEMGMAAFHSNEGLMASMRDEIPDSSGLSTNEAINALPEYVRNFKCGTSLEKGDPYCGSEKFTKWGCENRMKQTSWHPGFKDQALVGHGLGLFLMDALLSTLQDLTKYDDAATEELLSQLEKEDKDLHASFIRAEIPKPYRNLLKALNELTFTEGESKIDFSLFFKGKSICHTARLPSQTRYRGILTDTDMVGEAAPVGEETYYLGFDKARESNKATENNELRLVYDMYREREDKCRGIIVKPDYPDSFYTNSLDGWTKLTFPNEAEKKAYGYDPAHYEGIFIVHGKVCDWGKCPKGFLLPEEDHAEKNWEMKINNQYVTTVKNIGNGSVILGGENGFRFTANSNAQYEIEIKVNKENHYFQLFDFVLY